MRQCRVVRLATVVVACLLGCEGGARLLGGKGGAGGRKYASPKATFNTMWEAAKAGNKDGMMACFSDACRKKMVELEKLMADLPKEITQGKGGVTDQLVSKAKTAKIEIGAQRLDGDEATLEVSTDGDKEPLHFIKERGAWKLHIPELAALDIEQLEKSIQMLKELSKKTQESTEKGKKEEAEKGLKEKAEKGEK